MNGSEYVKNINAIVTIIDSEGGLFKSGKQEVDNGNIFINYIFSNNVQNKIIVQLYKNNQGFALASFDFQLPNLSPPENNIFSNFFQTYLKIFPIISGNGS
ncbi:MAG: hypothetical protein M3Z01_02470 [Thermoproteota archaeon]|nr:hypothetical protein [Thermoproteota archaeon]